MFKILKIVFLILFVYALAYFCFRQSHIENWEFDKQDYVMFTKEQSWLYTTFIPAIQVDKQWTGMLFQIGPHPDVIALGTPPLPTIQCLFKSVNEVLDNKNSCYWVDPRFADSISVFIAMHFDHGDPDHIYFNYTNDCIIKFPCRLENNKIDILWSSENTCDMKVTGKKDDNNKPFVSLELENDSTLKSIILNKELVQKLNTFDKSRPLIPERFCILNINM